MVLGQKKCTIEAPVSFIESVRQDWEDGIAGTKAVFNDLKNVFDTVKNSILFLQTKQFGIRGQMLNFLQS